MEVKEKDQIEGISPDSGIGYVVTDTGRTRRVVGRLTTVFSVSVPCKGMVFDATYDADKNALMGNLNGERFGVRVGKAVRNFIDVSETLLIEEANAEKARIQAIADSITKQGQDYVSKGGRFRVNYANESIVRVRIKGTDLEDTTRDGSGFHHLYLGSDSFTGAGERLRTKYYAVSDKLLKEAEDFHTGVLKHLEDRKKAKRDENVEAAKSKRVAIFDKERETGQDQLIESYSTGCSSRSEECSVDIVSIFAKPDGTMLKTRSHTW